MVRFFADQCVPLSLAVSLRNAGYEVHQLADHLDPRAHDELVIAKAQELDCVLLTLNGDFSDIVSYPPQNYKGICAIQLRNKPSLIPRIVASIADYLQKQTEESFFHGKLLIVEPGRIRVKS